MNEPVFRISRFAVTQVADFLYEMARTEDDPARREFYLVASAGLREHAETCDPKTGCGLVDGEGDRWLM